ncbi:MAG: HlyC/CorC family transporter [Phycisphaeraceae bacterium]|nr:HlyC/CorC family transporter [Phycisphaeraceae bacterium]
MSQLLSSNAWMFIAIVALLAMGVFGAIFHSLRDLSRSALEEVIKHRVDHKRASRVRKIIDDPDGHAAAVALARVALSIISATGFLMWIVDHTSAPNTSVTVLWVWTIAGITLTCGMIWLAGTVIPQSVARHLAEPTIYGFASLVRAMYVVTAPLRLLVGGIDAAVRLLAGKEEVGEMEAMQAELLDVVAEAKEEGQLDETEHQMIRAVVKFRDTTVRAIMTPRTEMEVLELTNDLGRITSTIREGGHSRIPVFEDSVDRIIGVFYIKDLLRWLAGVGGSRGGKTFDLRAQLRPAIFVPETKTIRDLLDEMLEKRVHISIVLDEYGGTAGVVTLEDIVEEFFGDVHDEYEKPEDSPGAKTDEVRRSAELDARSYISDANEAMEPLGLSIPESEDYSTVGGFITVALGRIPETGEQFEIRAGGSKMLVSVLEAEPTRLVRVRIENPPAKPAEGGAVPAQIEIAPKSAADDPTSLARSAS